MRIVLKFGTGILTRPEGATLDMGQFRRLTAEIAEAVASGVEVVVVSSGAVAAGLMALGLKERPTDLPTIQACAAVGQSRLMRLYQNLLGRHGLLAAQLLLTHPDIDSRRRHANARNTLARLLADRRVVPIINENDTVAIEELKFGDNDRLSAEVAILVAADQLILFTSADGLMTSLDGDGQLIPRVENLDEAEHWAQPSKGALSIGGMASKLQAVRLAVENGIPTTIANGRRPALLAAILRGEPAGTLFPAAKKG